MARDLSQFVAQHKENFSRYLNTTSSIVSKYESLEDELDSVLDISNCHIVKDRRGTFRKYLFGDKKVFPKENEVKRRHTERKKPTSPGPFVYTEDEFDRTFQLLKDVSSDVASFLEDCDEAEPSDAETLGSSDSYETVGSECEDSCDTDIRSVGDTQGEISADSQDERQNSSQGDQATTDVDSYSSLTELTAGVNRRTDRNPGKCQSSSQRRPVQNHTYTIQKPASGELVTTKSRSWNAEAYTTLDKVNFKSRTLASGNRISHGTLKEINNNCINEVDRKNAKKRSPGLNTETHRSSEERSARKNSSERPKSVNEIFNELKGKTALPVEADHKNNEYHANYQYRYSGNAIKESQVNSSAKPVRRVSTQFTPFDHVEKQVNVENSFQSRFDIQHMEVKGYDNERAEQLYKKNTGNFEQKSQENLQNSGKQPSIKKHAPKPCSYPNKENERNGQHTHTFASPQHERVRQTSGNDLTPSPRSNWKKSKASSEAHSRSLIAMKDDQEHLVQRRSTGYTVTEKFSKPPVALRQANDNTTGDRCRKERFAVSANETKQDSGIATLHESSVTSSSYDTCRPGQLTLENVQKFDKENAEHSQSWLGDVSMNASCTQNTDDALDRVERWLFTVTDPDSPRDRSDKCYEDGGAASRHSFVADSEDVVYHGKHTTVRLNTYHGQRTQEYGTNINESPSSRQALLDRLSTDSFDSVDYYSDHNLSDSEIAIDNVNSFGKKLAIKKVDGIEEKGLMVKRYMQTQHREFAGDIEYGRHGHSVQKVKQKSPRLKVQSLELNYDPVRNSEGGLHTPDLYYRQETANNMDCERHLESVQRSQKKSPRLHSLNYQHFCKEADVSIGDHVKKIKERSLAVRIDDSDRKYNNMQYKNGSERKKDKYHTVAMNVHDSSVSSKLPTDSLQDISLKQIENIEDEAGNVYVLEKIQGENRVKLKIRKSLDHFKGYQRLSEKEIADVMKSKNYKKSLPDVCMKHQRENKRHLESRETESDIYGHGNKADCRVFPGEHHSPGPAKARKVSPSVCAKDMQQRQCYENRHSQYYLNTDTDSTARRYHSREKASSYGQYESKGVPVTSKYTYGKGTACSTGMSCSGRSPGQFVNENRHRNRNEYYDSHYERTPRHSMKKVGTMYENGNADYGKKSAHSESERKYSGKHTPANTVDDGEYPSAINSRNSEKKRNDEQKYYVEKDIVRSKFQRPSFSSPNLERKNPSEKSDEFSPCTSMSKLQLNTPRSKCLKDDKRQRKLEQVRKYDQNNNNDMLENDSVAGTAVYRLVTNDRDIAYKNYYREINQEKLDRHTVDQRAKDHLSKLTGKPSGHSRRQSFDYDMSDFINSGNFQDLEQSLTQQFGSKGKSQTMDLSRSVGEISKTYTSGRQRRYSSGFISLESLSQMPHQLRVQMRPSVERNSLSGEGCGAGGFPEQTYDTATDTVAEGSFSGNECMAAPIPGVKQAHRENPMTSAQPKICKDLFSAKLDECSPFSKVTGIVSPIANVATGKSDFKVPSALPKTSQYVVRKTANVRQLGVNSSNKSSRKSDLQSTRDRLKNELSYHSKSKSHIPLEFCQSTPVRSGTRFSLDVSMSTIMGYEEPQLDLESNDELVLL